MFLLFVINFILGLSLVFLAYWLKAKKLITNETSRKLVHFTHALVVAGWPVFFGYWFVILAEILFLGAVLYTQEYKIFHHLRQIGRITWGEFFFPVGVIILALIAPPTWVFAAAMLLLGLADGTAAILGKRINKGVYMVYGHKKTLVGSLAFFVISMLVMLSVLWIAPPVIENQRLLLMVVGIPLLTTLVENISPFGSDNLTIPLAVYFGVISLGMAG